MPKNEMLDMSEEDFNAACAEFDMHDATPVCPFCVKDTACPAREYKTCMDCLNDPIE